MGFDRDLFSDLLKKAKGDRSINKYGIDAGVDPGYISRLMRCLIDAPPSANIIKKLSNKAYNDVSIEELMAAAGYLPPQDDAGQTDTKKMHEFPSLATKDQREIEKILEQTRESLEKNEGLMLSGDPVSPEAIESILGALEFGMRQAKVINKKYTPKKYRKNDKEAGE